MLVLAHQYLEQLPRALQQAILANCGSFIVFRVGAYDAKLMAAELGIDNEQALSDTANFTAWVKLLQDGNPSDPFLLETLVPEPPEEGRSRAVRGHTRARHTRERARVEQSVRQQISD
jgi:hypothetical protein